MSAMPALYRSTPSEDWQEVELLGRHRSGALVLREVDKRWPGVWLASADTVRVPASALAFEPGTAGRDASSEAMRQYWAGAASRSRRLPSMTPSQRAKYRIIRTLVGDQTEALRVVLGGLKSAGGTS